MILTNFNGTSPRKYPFSVLKTMVMVSKSKNSRIGSHQGPEYVLSNEQKSVKMVKSVILTSSKEGSIQGFILNFSSELGLLLVQYVLIARKNFLEAQWMGSRSHFWWKFSYQIGENRNFRKNRDFCCLWHTFTLLFNSINEYFVTMYYFYSVLTYHKSI